MSPRLISCLPHSNIQMRARRILGTKLEFIDNPSFGERSEAATILGPLPEPPAGKTPRRPKAPKGLPPYLGSLYEVPLLDREQEMHMFRQMNYLKYQAHQRRVKLDPGRAGPPISTRSSGCRKRRWPSRTRSSGPISVWSSRSPSGTSVPRTTFSSWFPTATCR